MTVEPPPDYREEVDIVRIDPLFLERQRNRYASRAVAFLVILNGIAPFYCLPISLASVRKLRTRLRWQMPWWCLALVWQRLLRACSSPTFDAPSCLGRQSGHHQYHSDGGLPSLPPSRAPCALWWASEWWAWRWRQSS
jgi:hypothetical protein